jgi:hypothetical protein
MGLSKRGRHRETYKFAKEMLEVKDLEVEVTLPGFGLAGTTVSVILCQTVAVLIAVLTTVETESPVASELEEPVLLRVGTVELISFPAIGPAVSVLWAAGDGVG